jgi:DNA (cytosine-5)-methyltransferase 1
MRYGSVCSGIEAATMAWHGLGWKPAFFSEIERFPSAVLAHHYPDVPNHGDMTKFQEWPDHAVDLLVGGTPCQSFSVAGLRKGMADPRGNLALTYLAIAARYRPRWLVWENVPGVLSSDGGRDFGAFLGGLGQLGYGFAYRVLDAQFVRTREHPGAVPQRRRRVFVVGHLGDWRRAAAVLFDRESLSGNPAPRREAGQVAPTVPSRSTAGGGLGTDFDCDGGAIAIQERAVSENLENGPQGSGVRRDGAAYTLEARNKAQAVAFAQNTRDEVRLIGGDGASVGALAAQPGTKQQAYLAVAHSLRAEGFDASEDGTGRGTPLWPVAVAPTLNAAFGDKQGLEDQHALSGAGHFVPGVVGALACNTGPNGHDAGNFACNQSVDAGHLIPATMAVRRLTPRECERLQGFPDDFSKIPYRGKPADQCPDGPRYKALGNSMAVNVMRWIGERIALVDAIKEAA